MELLPNRYTIRSEAKIRHLPDAMTGAQSGQPSAVTQYPPMLILLKMLLEFGQTVIHQ